VTEKEGEAGGRGEEARTHAVLDGSAAAMEALEGDEVGGGSACWLEVNASSRRSTCHASHEGRQAHSTVQSLVLREKKQGVAGWMCGGGGGRAVR
jgi:hypothetical protein